MSGPMSPAQCTLEMVQLDKHESVSRLCRSVSSLYSQLQETERGEKHWVSSERREHASLVHQVRTLQADKAHLRSQLSLVQRAVGQNEKLDLSLEELTELYDHSSAQDKSDREAAAEAARNLDVARRTAASATAVVGQLRHRDEERQRQDAQLRQELAVQHRALLEVEEKAKKDTIAMEREVAVLQGEARDSSRLRKTLALSQQSSHVESDQLRTTTAQVKSLTAETVQLKSSLSQATEAAATAQSQVEVLLQQLKESREGLKKANARVAELEANAKGVQQKAELACASQVQQCYAECASKV